MHAAFSRFVYMYSHMLAMQQRIAELENTVARQPDELQLTHKHSQPQQPYAHNAGQSAHVGEYAAEGDDAGNYEFDEDDDDDSCSSSDGVESNDEEAEGESENEPHGHTSTPQAPVDTTDALAGAARVVLRMDPNAGDASANAILLQRHLKSCVQRMCAQEELLQHALVAAQPVPPSSQNLDQVKQWVSQLQGALAAAVAVAHSFIRDNAVLQADAAEREAQVLMMLVAAMMMTVVMMAITMKISQHVHEITVTNRLHFDHSDGMPNITVRPGCFSSLCVPASARS